MHCLHIHAFTFAVLFFHGNASMSYSPKHDVHTLVIMLVFIAGKFRFLLAISKIPPVRFELTHDQLLRLAPSTNWATAAFENYYGLIQYMIAKKIAHVTEIGNTQNKRNTNPKSHWPVEWYGRNIMNRKMTVKIAGMIQTLRVIVI